MKGDHLRSPRGRTTADIIGTGGRPDHAAAFSIGSGTAVDSVWDSSLRAMPFLWFLLQLSAPAPPNTPGIGAQIETW